MHEQWLAACPDHTYGMFCKIPDCACERQAKAAMGVITGLVNLYR